MSVPAKNTPIGLKNVVTSFEGVSDSELYLSSITLFPGSQPEPTATFVRNWNFNIAGKIVSTGISSFSIVMDLSEVVPSYVIDFKGALYGTLQIGSHLYASDKHIVLVPDNEKKQITLVVSLECPRKSFVFTLNSTISDGGSSSITWTDQTTVASGTNWADCAISSTGQYQAAVNNNSEGTVYAIYVSSNYGSAWTGVSISGVSKLGSVVVSATGKYMYAGDLSYSYIYMSSDYGASWGPLSGSNIAATGGWIVQACSSDGTSYLYAINVASGATSLYVFENNTPTNITPSGGYILSLNNGCACSADGTIALLIGETSSGVSSVLQFVSSSTTWTTLLTSTTINYNGIAMSFDGTVIYVSNVSNSLSVSTDSGSSWSSVSLPSDFSVTMCISCSVDTVLIGSLTNLYLSTDQGTTWVTQSPVVGSGTAFNSCSMNSDVTYLVTTVSGGDLWTGNDASS